MALETTIDVAGRPAGFMVGRRGPRGRPLVLFLHGSGGSARTWLPQVSPLDREFGTAALDLPGRGRTPGPPLTDVWPMGAFAVAAARALQPEYPPVLAGISLGGAAALAAALQSPETWSGLILVSTGARLHPHPQLLSVLRQDYAAGLTLFAELLHGAEGEPELVRRSRAVLAECPAATLLADLEASSKFDVEDRLGEISLPALVLAGAADRLAPPALSRRLAEGLAASRLTVFENVGHAPNLERHREVNIEIIDFVRDIFP
ncbi:MAG: alpha/beta fold hydrolase [Pseudomonadota bacterium]